MQEQLRYKYSNSDKVATSIKQSPSCITQSPFTAFSSTQNQIDRNDESRPTYPFHYREKTQSEEEKT